MTFRFPALLRRSFLYASLATAGLLTTACLNNDPPKPAPYQDFSKADDDIIQKYLTDNSITTAQKQPSGLYYVPQVTAANGVRATRGRTVSVLYTGRFRDGRIFDSTSLRNNAPFEFPLGAGRVIDGWDEGVALMRKGEKALFLVPSALAYGNDGSGSTIPPNTVLSFEIEVLDVR